MPRRRNTPGGPAAFAAYANGPGARAAAAAAAAVQGQGRRRVCLALRQIAGQLVAPAPARVRGALRATAGRGISPRRRWRASPSPGTRNSTATSSRGTPRRASSSTASPRCRRRSGAHDDANDLLFAEASAQRVWRHEDGTGLVRVGASVFLDATGPLACVATAEADALVLCGDQSR